MRHEPFNDTHGGRAIDPVVPLRELAAQTGHHFYVCKGFALGRGMPIFRIGTTEVLERGDAEVIRKALPRTQKKARKPAPATH